MRNIIERGGGVDFEKGKVVYNIIISNFESTLERKYSRCRKLYLSQ